MKKGVGYRGFGRRQPQGVSPRETPAGPEKRLVRAPAQGPTLGAASAQQVCTAHPQGDSVVTGVDSIDSMILPQVHLRKPCYDFSFL